ncbi:MAG: polynucleotide adenylyltransferase PcnB [Pigmentiphaga sp.]|nr:polynucleotide adenylyltransferase PcnB [Pigmentiphaga sp.]
MLKQIVDRVDRILRRGKPRRIPASEHGIDRRNVSRHAIKVCEVLQQHGFQAYVVGGAVRDLIAGVEPKDFDVATDATPEQVKPLFRRARIIGRRFRLVHVVFGAEVIETSTFRAAGSSGQSTDAHGRLLQDNVFGSLQDDAARRDFTLNALYYDPHTEEVIDYHHGVADLKQRTVRIIGDPQVRYREDPVRMLRAVRFAAKLNGTIEPATREPIAALASLIENVPASRLFDEMLKLLTCGHAMDCVRRLRQHGLHHGLLPLLDVILEQPGGERFVELTLERTDARVRSGKSISPAFLFASLLWQQVNQRWQTILAQGQPAIPALAEAVDSVLAEQTDKLAIQKRFVTDMRDIWFMQPRFEKRSPRFVWRLLEQPRFRAACDFLQLRAAAGEVDSVFAQWWMDLADASDAERAHMLDDLSRQPEAAAADAPKRRRRRRRKPAPTDGQAPAGAA